MLVALLTARMVRPKFKQVTWLGASYLFYASWTPWFLLVLLGSSVCNFVWRRRLRQHPKASVKLRSSLMRTHRAHAKCITINSPATPVEQRSIFTMARGAEGGCRIFLDRRSPSGYVAQVGPTPEDPDDSTRSREGIAPVLLETKALVARSPCDRSRVRARLLHRPWSGHWTIYLHQLLTFEDGCFAHSRPLFAGIRNWAIP